MASTPYRAHDTGPTARLRIGPPPSPDFPPRLQLPPFLGIVAQIAEIPISGHKASRRELPSTGPAAKCQTFNYKPTLDLPKFPILHCRELLRAAR